MIAPVADERAGRPVCCDEFRDAVESTFAEPIDEPTGWVLYGTDHTTVAAGQPELRYWPIRFCPFCGQRLTLPPPDLLRRPHGKAP
jgi:hypothetical protein